ncbi:MAG: hypothetical protein ACI9S8_003011 [Chlamydiales bacterium]|jgi:hypothetical protein
MSFNSYSLNITYDLDSQIFHNLSAESLNNLRSTSCNIKSTVETYEKIEKFRIVRNVLEARMQELRAEGETKVFDGWGHVLVLPSTYKIHLARDIFCSLGGITNEFDCGIIVNEGLNETFSNVDTHRRFYEVGLSNKSFLPRG